MNSLAEMFNPKLIAKSWVDSLKIFIPANFKLFALVTLKSFIEGLKVFFSGIFWVGLLCAIMAMCLEMLAGMAPTIWQDNQLAFQVYYYVSIIASLIVTIGSYIFQFGWLISIRASVDKKDRTYIKKYRWAFPVMAGIWIMFRILFNYIAEYIKLPFLSLVIFALFMISAWITVFFFVESGRTVKEFFQSFWRMKLFSIFNLPGLAIFYCVYAAIIGLQIRTESAMAGVIISFVYIFILMLGTCALYNYFIKRFHDHSELYF